MAGDDRGAGDTVDPRRLGLLLCRAVTIVPAINDRLYFDPGAVEVEGGLVAIVIIGKDDGGFTGLNGKSVDLGSGCRS